MLIAAVAIAEVFLVGCGKPEPATGIAAPVAAMEVETTVSSIRDVSRLASLPAEAKPIVETTLFSKVPGFLTSISVDKGDRVFVGQRLASVGTPELDADRDVARQNFEAANAGADGNASSTAKAQSELQKSRESQKKAAADFKQLPSMLAKATSQLRIAESSVKQAEDERAQAAARLQEAKATLGKSESEVTGALAEQSLAEATYRRYLGIYRSNPQLIAKQDIDVAESKAIQARSRVGAAQRTVEVSRQGVLIAQAQLASRQTQIEQAKEGITMAREQVKLVLAQQESASQQLNVAARDVEIAGHQLETSRAEMARARFQSGAGRSALERQASIANYAQIKAPFSGVVTKRFVDPGALLQGAAPVLTVADVSSIRIQVNISESEARFIHVGGVVKITFSGLPGEKFEGKIARTANSLDSKSRTLLAEVILPNPKGQILAGSFAQTKVVLETHKSVVSVPNLAVGSDKSGKFAFLNDHGKAKRVSIKTGFDDGVFTEITEGLKLGDEVVVVGRDNLSKDTPLKAKNWEPAPKKD